MVFIFVSGGGPLMTCVSIGMMILSMFGFDVDQSYQVMVVLGIAVVGLATFSTSFREAIATALPAYLRDMIFNDEEQQRPQRTQQDEEWTDIADKIRNTPIETYTASLSSLSSKELKKRLKNRDVDTSHCVERKELLDLLCKHSRGTSENCIICFEDYEEGDAMRVLSACKHTYHIECIDRWAFAKKSQAKCPMCNTPIR